MPALNSYDYAIIRVVPRVERGECVNVGIILFCPTRRYLAVRVVLDRSRLLALAPTLDLDAVQRHLEFFHLTSQGGPAAGALRHLSLSERFHWLVAPRSTIIQTSPAHSGLCRDPQEALEHLLTTLVVV